MVTAAHFHGSKAALLLVRFQKELLCGIRSIVADGGYREEIIEQVKKLLMETSEEMVRLPAIKLLLNKI